MDSLKMPFHEHNIADGAIHHCQVCGSSNLALVIDLGHQPLCDTLLSKAQLSTPETTYPLRLWRCKDCTLTQLDYAVKSDVVYHADYPYKCGVTKEVVLHMGEFARETIKKLGLTGKSLVVDVGSNDGTLLEAFQSQDIRVCGVEPTNVADVAIEKGVETYKGFFDEEASKTIVGSYGQCDLLTSTNVFAHMSSLGSVMRAAVNLLKKDGTFVIEVHYLLNVLKSVQYDTIYHEHLRTYSLRSLVTLFSMYGFKVYDAIVTERYNGTLRVYATRSESISTSKNVDLLLRAEVDFGIDSESAYAQFRQKVALSKMQLLKLILQAHEEGASVVGNSCPGRCSTLVNYVGITKDLMPYICEQPASAKLGLYLPGKHIPICNNQRLIEEQPDYVVLLAWHYADVITKELRARGLKSKLILPLPGVKVNDCSDYVKAGNLSVYSW